MQAADFLETFADLIQCDRKLSLTDRLEMIDEWDSMAMMVLIAYFDNKLKTRVTFDQLGKANTVEDIMNLLPVLEK